MVESSQPWAIVVHIGVVVAVGACNAAAGMAGAIDTAAAAVVHGHSTVGGRRTCSAALETGPEHDGRPARDSLGAGEGGEEGQAGHLAQARPGRSAACWPLSNKSTRRRADELASHFRPTKCCKQADVDKLFLVIPCCIGV